MKRTSAEVARLQRLCEEHGIPAPNSRRFERWTRDLLPSPNAPPAHQARHLGALDRQTRPGRSHDDIAFVLAANGYGCERYRSRVLEMFDVSWTEQAELVVDPDSDEGALRIDELATEYMEPPLSTLPRVFAGPLRHLMADNLARNPVYDPAYIDDGLTEDASSPNRPESPAAVMHSGGANLLAELAGEEPCDQAANDALFGGPDHLSVDDAVVVARYTAQVVRQAPLDTLVRAAQLVRVNMKIVVPDMDPETRDKLAAMQAPFVLATQLAGLELHQDLRPPGPTEIDPKIDT